MECLLAQMLLVAVPFDTSPRGINLDIVESINRFAQQVHTKETFVPIGKSFHKNFIFHSLLQQPLVG